MPAAPETKAQECTGPPSEAINLNLSGPVSTQLSWQPPVNPGGTQTVVYDVLRSPTATDFDFMHGDCVASGSTALTVSDWTAPAPILFYLVRARNGCGGTLGTNSFGTPRSGVTCLLDTGDICLYDYQCYVGGCCAGFCRNLSRDPNHCGGCANVCSMTNMATRTCANGVCNGTCFSGTLNCDGDMLYTGCECTGAACCSGACDHVHYNGLDQSFHDCAPLAVPGNPATYTASLAIAARASWPTPGSDFTVTCYAGPNQASAAVRQTATSCAVWVYQKSFAGYVHLNSASSSCVCPAAGDPTWR